MVKFKKVKVYRGNRFNKEADKLAKMALNYDDCLLINTNFFANISMSYKNYEIKNHFRSFVKKISHVSRLF